MVSFSSLFGISSLSLEFWFSAFAVFPAWRLLFGFSIFCLGLFFWFYFSFFGFFKDANFAFFRIKILIFLNIKRKNYFFFCGFFLSFWIFWKSNAIVLRKELSTLKSRLHQVNLFLKLKLFFEFLIFFKFSWGGYKICRLLIKRIWDLN